MSQDLRRTLAQGPLTRFQLGAIAVCIGLNMLKVTVDKDRNHVPGTRVPALEFIPDRLGRGDDRRRPGLHPRVKAIHRANGKDAAQKKITFPAVYGLAESKAMAEAERIRAHESLAMFGERALRLGELADLVVNRNA